MSVPLRHTRAAKPAVLVLFAACATYFGILACLAHERLRTFAFDLGTFDQGIWLAGHGSSLFVTVRGLHLLGDHVRLFSFVLAPLYFVWDDVRALLILQSVCIAAGAWFVFRISQRELPHRPWLALSLAAAWLLHPAVQNLNLDHAHPDAFASTFLVASVDFLRGRRMGAFWTAALLAMSCKEDVPLVFVAMGLMLMLEPKTRRTGAVLVAVASAYFALCLTVILPNFNGVGFFRFGHGRMLAGAAAGGGDPLWLFGRLLRTESLEYLLRLGAPSLFLFLVAPRWLVPAVPAVVVNLLSDSPYMRSLDFHYQTSVLPFLFVATTDALARIDRRLNSSAGRRIGLTAGAILAPLVLAAAVTANMFWSRAPIHHAGIVFEQWELVRTDPFLARIRRALRQIPQDAVVSADYALVPHLSHRERVYMFPNPFRASNWGVADENPHDSADVQYVILTNLAWLESAPQPVEPLVLKGRYERIDGDPTFSLYRRIDRIAIGSRAACGDPDGDGTITDADFRAIADAILHHRECPLSVCDVDGDGKLRNADALLVAKRVRDHVTPVKCKAAVLE